MEDNPTLNREHIDRIRSVALLRSVRTGEVLYEPSCPDVPLFIVLDGTVSISRTGEDEKILAVPHPKLHPFYNDVESYKDLPPVLIQQIEHFFAHYKDLERGKWVKVKRWAEPSEATDLIRAGIERALQK